MKFLRDIFLVFGFLFFTGTAGWCGVDDMFIMINRAADTYNKIQQVGGASGQTQETNTNNSQSQQGYQQQTQPQQNSPYSYTTAQQYNQVPTVKDLPAGSIVIDPTSLWNYNYDRYYSGNSIISAPVFWLTIENNHYTQDSTLLLAMASVASYPFNHKNKGLTSWQNSDVRRFLRTTFYQHFSPAFKSAIVEVNTESVDTAGKPYKVLDNVFLPSIVEYNLSDRKNNGTAFNYPYMNRDYKAYEVDIFQGSLYLRKEHVIDTWTRTINRPAAVSAGFKNDVFSIYRGMGVLDTCSAARDSRYIRVRPAVNIKSSTKVKGPYIMNVGTATGNITYYILDFSS